MTDHIFIVRVRPDGHIVEPDSWRIESDDGEVFVHRQPGESNQAFRSRAMLAAPIGTTLIRHHEVTKP